MSAFYKDYKEWLSMFKIIRETPDNESETVEYDEYSKPISSTTEEISVYGILEEKRASFVEISDRSKTESFKTFICDLYDINGNEIILKHSDKVKDTETDKTYRILDINSLLQHHYECEVQVLEVS